MKTLSRFALALLCLVSYATSQTTVFENAQLTAPAVQPIPQLGTSVAVSGDTVVVGAPGGSIRQPSGQGVAYVYVKPSTGWANMQPVAMLTPSSNKNVSDFGGNVAIYGDTIVVGTSGYYTNLYVFVKPEGGWKDMTETATLSASLGRLGPCLCGAIAINSNTIAVGSPEDTPLIGDIAVWNKRATGWVNSNTPDAILIHTNPEGEDDSFYSIAIGDNVIVGSGEVFNNKTEYAPRLFVFARPAGGWHGRYTQTAKLSPANGSLSGAFESVAISGNTVIATRNRNQNPEDPGLVHIWVEPEGGWTGTKEIATLGDGNTSFADYFGASAGISGDEIVVGAPHAFEITQGRLYRGGAYVFYKPAGGWQTTSTPDVVLRNSDGTVDDKFGNSMAISNGTIVIGAPHGPMRHLIGEAYIFDKQSN